LSRRKHPERPVVINLSAFLRNQELNPSRLYLCTFYFVRPQLPLTKVVTTIELHLSVSTFNSKLIFWIHISIAQTRTTRHIYKADRYIPQLLFCSCRSSHKRSQLHLNKRSQLRTSPHDCVRDGRSKMHLRKEDVQIDPSTAAGYTLRGRSADKLLHRSGCPRNKMEKDRERA
jgi:hypothetical protein